MVWCKSQKTVAMRTLTEAGASASVTAHSHTWELVLVVGRKPQSSLCGSLYRAAEHHQDTAVALPRATDERTEDEVTAPFAI